MVTGNACCFEAKDIKCMKAVSDIILYPQHNFACDVCVHVYIIRIFTCLAAFKYRISLQTSYHRHLHTNIFKYS